MFTMPIPIGTIFYTSRTILPPIKTCLCQEAMIKQAFISQEDITARKEYSVIILMITTLIISARKAPSRYLNFSKLITTLLIQM